MKNLPATLSTLQTEITALTDDLAPASQETIAACIDAMKRAGMTIPTGIPAGDIVSEYSIALRSVPKIGLKDAMRRIRQGEYTDMDYSFMPRPAELAKRARAEAARYRDDLVRKRETFASLTAAPAIKDPAMKGRVRKLVEEFKFGASVKRSFQ